MPALALLLVLGSQARAQLGEATPEEAKIGRPSPFTAITSKTPPSEDPRDFSGMWRSPRPGGSAGGPPPGGGPPPSGAGGPGAGGAAGAPAGGPPGGPGGAGGPGGPGGGGGGGNAFRASSRYCIPGTMILASVEGGTEILQTPSELRIVTEEHHNNRRIYIDQPHTQPVVRSVNGDSVAHWDGNTLVIETTAFEGYGVSPTLVRTERLSKSDDRRSLTDQISYSDSSGRTTPAAMSARLDWAPGTQVLEYICEDGSQDYMSESYK